MHYATPSNPEVPYAAMAAQLAHGECDLGDEHACILFLNRNGFLARDINAALEDAIEQARVLRADCAGTHGRLADALAALTLCLGFASLALCLWPMPALAAGAGAGNSLLGEAILALVVVSIAGFIIWLMFRDGRPVDDPHEQADGEASSLGRDPRR